MPIEFPEDHAVSGNVGVIPVALSKRGFQPVDCQIRLIDEGIGTFRRSPPDSDGKAGTSHKYCSAFLFFLVLLILLKTN